MVEETIEHHRIGSRRGADLAALSMMLFLVLSSVALSLVPIVRPQLQAAPFSLSDSQIGLLTSVFMLTFSVGALPAGMAASRWGGLTLLVGAGSVVVGSVLFALTKSYPLFLVARFLQGAGGSAAIPVCNSLIAHTILPRFRGRALGILGCGHGIGVVFALLVMPGIQDAGGYRAVFMATAGIAVVFAFVAASHRVVRSRFSRVQSGTGLAGLIEGVRTIAANRRLLLLITVNIGAMAVFIGVLTWTPSFLHDQRGASLDVAAYLTAGLGAAQILGNVGGAAAMGRWGKRRVMVGGIALMLVATALIPLVPGIVPVFVCVTVAGFLTMALFPVIMGSIPEIVERSQQVGPASGYLNVTGLFGTMLAPWLFGVLLDSYGTEQGTGGYLGGYMLLALFALLGTGAAVAYVTTQRRDQV